MVLKTHSWPENHWCWPVELSHYHGVRRGGLIFTGGQADLDGQGSVVNPDDLTSQTTNVLCHVEAILTDLGASLSDVVKLVVYFTGNAADETGILNLIASHLTEDTRPVVSTICLSALCYPGMRIELEAVAIDPTCRSASNPEYKRDSYLPALHPQYSHAIRCNDLIFTSDMSAIQNNGAIQASGDINEQSRIMMKQLERALELFDVTAQDVVKLNVFYLGDGTADNWSSPAAIRAAFFDDPGPAATKSSNTRYAWPHGHWNWTSPLPYKHGNRCGQIIHIGGQVALDIDANVLHPNDIVAQTQIALRNIKTILSDLDAVMDDIVKVTTFYQGSASAESLHKNLLIRSDAFHKPGPATSGIPVPCLVYENMVIEIEVIAVVDN